MARKAIFQKCANLYQVLRLPKSTACNAIRDTDVDPFFSIFAVGNSLHSFDINIDGVTMQVHRRYGYTTEHHSQILHSPSRTASNKCGELTAYGGNKLTVVGTCILLVAYKNMNTTASFYVVETQASDKPLLSTELCEAFRSPERSYSIINDSQCEKEYSLWSL